jgi:hypothetical protein
MSRDAEDVEVPVLAHAQTDNRTKATIDLIACSPWA